MSNTLQTGTSRKLLAAMVLASLATVVGTAPSHAQATNGKRTQTKTAAKKRITQLGTVMVTAEKRKENLQKVPMSISVIDADQMRDQHKLTLAAILGETPGVEVQQTATGPQFAIRSVGPTGRPGGEQAVAVYKDGVYFDRIDSMRGALLDVARVETLMGPQGTLYGRNALAGVVNIVYNEPVLGTFSGSGGLGFGNYGEIDENGVLNIPLGEKLALRAAYSGAQHDGYLSDGLDDENDHAGRVKLRYAPTDDLDMIFTLEQDRVGGRGESASEVTADWPDRSGWKPWTDTADASGLYQDTRSTMADLHLIWTTPIGTLTFLPAFVRNVYSGLQENNGTKQIEDRTKTQDSYELRLASPDGDSKLTWQVGAYGYDANEPQRFTTLVAVEPVDGYPVDDTLANRTKSWAVFGQATVSLTDTLRVVAGARYTHDERSMTFAGGNFAEGGSGTPATESTSYEKPTWKLGVEWDAAPASMLYATVSTGYRAGDVSGSPNGVTATLPQLMTQYAIGAKNRFFDNRLQVNTELYYSDYKNYLIDLSYQVSPEQPPQAFIENAKHLTIKGLDLDVDYDLTANDDIHLGFNYLDAKFGTQPTFSDPSITDETELASLRQQLAYYSGATKPYAPRRSLTLAWSHYWNLANGGTLMLRPDVTYASSAYVSLLTTNVNDPAALQPAYHLYNISLDYTAPDGNWGMGIYGRNLDNTPVVTDYSAALNAGTVATVNVGPPRTYGAQFWAKF